MIPRYSRKEMSAIWEAENRYAKWLQIEILACEAMVRQGRVPPQALQKIQERAGFDVSRIEEIEKVVKHDVIAFLTAVGERVGPEARYLHLGMTSSDILDTAFALQLVEATERLEKDMESLLRALKRRAYETKDDYMVGRTHGMHAEPITLGLVFALWFSEMERNKERLSSAKKTHRLRENLRGRGDLCPCLSRGGSVCLREVGSQPGTDIESNRPKRPPRRVFHHPGPDRYFHRENRPFKSATSSARNFPRLKNLSLRAKRDRRPCPTSGIPSLPRTSWDWPGCPGECDGCPGERSPLA
jgi:hypothetical protein